MLMNTMTALRARKDKHHELTRTDEIGAGAHFADFGTIQRFRSSAQTAGYHRLSRQRLRYRHRAQGSGAQSVAIERGRV